MLAAYIFFKPRLQDADWLSVNSLQSKLPLEQPLTPDTGSKNKFWKTVWDSGVANQARYEHITQTKSSTTHLMFDSFWSRMDSFSSKGSSRGGCWRSWEMVEKKSAQLQASRKGSRKPLRYTHDAQI